MTPPISPLCWEAQPGFHLPSWVAGLLCGLLLVQVLDLLAAARHFLWASARARTTRSEGPTYRVLG